MKNVKILDCTLRDGGRIIDCAFSDYEIHEITDKLANAKIDIIEVGFLRDHRIIEYRGNSTFFTDVNQITPFIDKTKEEIMYVAFIDFGMFDIDSLKENDGSSIDGIRFGFTKKDYETNADEVIKWAKTIKNKGYKLFLQGVNSLNYTDKELLEIVDMVNDIQPYSFGIVDTYGAMYMDDVDRIYGLVDNNMKPDICINFHSHNNYQLSFAFAQEIIKLSSNSSRKVIIDGTLGGMGKVAGNLNTELIVDYLVRKLHYYYEFEDLLDLIDDIIYNYMRDYKWGYSTAALMAGIYKSHPNNVIYLVEKFRLDTKDIGRILSMIEPQLRQRYDYDNIQRLYTEYVADKVDDYSQISMLKQRFENKEILILVPGNSLNTYKKKIDIYIEKHAPIVISVNFVAEYPEGAYAFFGNAKRYARLAKKREGKKVIISSNIKPDNSDDIIVNYHSIINRGYKYFENSTIMLLNLLKRINPSNISIAGFDGFGNSSKNYVDSSYQNDRHIDEFELLNSEIMQMFGDIVSTMYPACHFSMITPSIFEDAVIRVLER